jgi:hypothetical protein
LSQSSEGYALIRYHVNGLKRLAIADKVKTACFMRYTVKAIYKTADKTIP